MKRLVWVTTVAQSMGLFRGQLAFLARYFDLTFVASNESDSHELAQRGAAEGIKVHRINMRREIAVLHDVCSLWQFVVYFLKTKPDLVHGNTPKGALFAMVAARLTNVKARIYMCHGLRYQGCKGVMKLILMTMERITCACATHVLCVSEGVRQQLATDGLCRTSKSRVIGQGSCNGIDPDRYNPSLYGEEQINRLRARYGIDKGSFLFVYIGRIVKDKGVEELIDAYKRLHTELSHTNLMMIGSFENTVNPVCTETATLIRARSHGVMYVGQQADVRLFLASAQCLVLPSYREGFGMVLMEAGAMGVPVIGTDIIGCNNVVLPDNGLLVKPRDGHALYCAMKRMVEDKTLRQHIAAATRASIVNRFDQAKLWKAYLKFYQSIAD